MSITRVKICCINSKEEAQMAIDMGASAIGLVGPMPSGPGVIDDNLINEIAKTVPPPIATFLLTSETSAEKIIDHHRKAQTNTIQIVDQIDKSDYQIIREALPKVKIVQVIHVIDNHSVLHAIEISEYVDALLLDSGNPNLKVKELGGTGRTHNWDLSKEIRQSVKIPLFLAGGLNPDNVRQAVDFVRPFGVDLCSGVRTNGNLDEKKLRKFFRQVVN